MLSSGQPAAPWTLTHRLDEPLPPDEFLVLVNDPETAGPSVFRAGTDAGAHVSDTTLVPAQLSPDRRTATFEVSHLSLLQIIRGSWDDVQRFGENAVEFGGAVGATLADGAAAANHALADYFGDRGAPPNCGASSVEGADVPPPAWVSDVVFVDDPNAPILVCATGGEGPSAATLLVKIVNNRAMPMLVSSPVPPLGVSSTFGEEDFGDPGQVWTVPGTEMITLFFEPGQLVTGTPPLRIDSAFTSDAAARATVAALTGAELAQELLGSVANEVWNDAAEEICVAQSAAVTQPEAPTGVQSYEFARCVVERSPEIVTLAEGRLTPAQLQSAQRGLRTVANLAKRANVVFAAAGEFFRTADNLATVNLVDAASQVSVFWQPLGDPCAGPDEFGRVVETVEPGFSSSAYGGSERVERFTDVECADGVALAIGDIAEIDDVLVALLPTGDGWYELVSSSFVGVTCAEFDPRIPAELLDGYCLAETETVGPIDNPFGCNFDPSVRTFENPCAFSWTQAGNPGEPGDADGIPDDGAEIEGGGTSGQRWFACYLGYESFC